MRQSLQLLVPALAALVLVIWLVSTGEDGENAVSASAAEAARGPALLRSDQPVASGDEAALGARARRNETLTAPAVAEELTAAARGREVIAIVGAARRRVSEVELWWSEEPEGEPTPGHEGVWRHLWRGELDAFLRARATPLVADAEQRFYLDSTAFNGLVVARAPGLFGRAEFERHELGACYVELEPDDELLARVVDGSGAPVAGVGVALRQFWGGAFFHDHARVETDGTGVARLEHFRALIDGDWDFDGRYCVAIAEPLGVEVAHFIEITRPPRERIELVLPPVGVVELEAPGATPGTAVQLQVASSPSATDPERDEAEEPFSDGQRRLVDGRVRFPFVGVGLEFVPWTLDAFGSRGHERSRFRGPRAAGQVVNVQLQLERERTRVAGRLVDESGLALGRTQLHATLTARANADDDVEPWERSGSCDESGRFELEFPCANPGACELRIDARDGLRRHLGQSTQPLNLSSRVELIELGDVRLRALPLVAAGLVENARGEPVPGAGVEVFVHSQRTHYDGTLREQWRRLEHGNVRCDEAGRFEVRAPNAPARIVLRATDAANAVGMLEARGGARELVVVLDSDGEIAGRLLLSETMATDYLHISVAASGGQTSSLPLPISDSYRVDSSAEFSIRRLAPGSYDFTVSMQGRDAPLARIAGVQVRAGVSARDPRLDPLDLRRVGELVEVQFLDADGKEARDVTRCTLVESEDSETYSADDWLSSGRLLLERSDRPLWVVAADCVVQRVDPATVGPQVRFSRAPIVRVVFEAGLELPLDKLQARLRFMGAGEARMLTNCVHDELYFESNGVAEGRVRRLGPVEVELWLEAENSARLAVEIVSGGRLAESSLPQVLTLRFSPQDRDEAVAEAFR